MSSFLTRTCIHVRTLYGFDFLDFCRKIHINLCEEFMYPVKGRFYMGEIKAVKLNFFSLLAWLLYSRIQLI
jgi:hypothetical protein